MAHDNAHSRPASAVVARWVDPRQQQPVALPIYQTTTFVMDEALVSAMNRGDYRTEYLYTRMGNPTVRALEERLAALHGAEDGLCTASGMAALSAALIGNTAPGDGIVAANQLYGVTTAFLVRFLARMGREVVFADTANPEAIAAAAASLAKPAWLLVETISNPLMQVSPIAAQAAQARALGMRLMVDNTFANPLLCRPLALGADLVVESLSKSISGHSDVHGGLVAGAAEPVRLAWDAMVHLGSCLDPHAAALIWRGLKTAVVRTDASCERAAALVGWLQEQGVERVFHPSLQAGWQETLTAGGPMLSFVVSGGDARAERLLQALKVATPATSLGGVETLVSLPYNTSHRTPEARAQIGLLPGTVRLSVGIEAFEDLRDDLAQALTASA
jgi:methionine-gamma-lyase